MRIVHKGICTNAPLGFSVFVISDDTPFVISTKCGTAARMEKSINKARFLDYGLTPSTRNGISNIIAVRKAGVIYINARLRSTAAATRRFEMT